LDFNPGCVEGHRPPTVKPASIFWRHLQWSGDEIPTQSVADSKEVSKGNLDGWIFLAIPPHTDHALARIDIVIAHGKPNVFNASWPIG
jgi:hypothetical protein